MHMSKGPQSIFFIMDERSQLSVSQTGVKVGVEMLIAPQFLLLAFLEDRGDIQPCMNTLPTSLGILKNVWAHFSDFFPPQL